MYFAEIRQNITNFFLSLSIEKYTFQNFTNLVYYTKLRINSNGLVCRRWKLGVSGLLEQQIQLLHKAGAQLAV
jgi:hypothetical protein